MLKLPDGPVVAGARIAVNIAELPELVSKA
jgi:hypothetical protein